MGEKGEKERIVGKKGDSFKYSYLAAKEAAFFLSLLALAAVSASLNPTASLLETSMILKAGAELGRMSVSSLSGVPSMVPHVMRGEASTPGRRD